MPYKRTLFLALVASLGAIFGTWWVNGAMHATGNNGEFCLSPANDGSCTSGALTSSYFSTLTLWYFLFFVSLFLLLSITDWLTRTLKKRRAKC